MTALSVAIIDNNCFVTDKVTEMLTGSDEFAMGCVAETVDEMMSALRDGQVTIDVVLLDFFLADASRAIDNVDRILTSGLPLLVVSSEPDHPDVTALLQLRPVSFLSTTELMHELLDAIRRVANGDMVMKQATMTRLRSAAPLPSPNLTPRQLDVFRLWASTGMPAKQLASRLGISEDVTRDHMTQIREKFRHIGKPVEDAVTRYETAIKYGYIAPPRERR
jgi:DNA-binding NarL/FixJ family response regulator